MQESSRRPIVSSILERLIVKTEASRQFRIAEVSMRDPRKTGPHRENLRVIVVGVGKDGCQYFLAADWVDNFLRSLDLNSKDDHVGADIVTAASFNQAGVCLG